MPGYTTVKRYTNIVVSPSFPAPVCVHWDTYVYTLGGTTVTGIFVCCIVHLMFSDVLLYGVTQQLGFLQLYGVQQSGAKLGYWDTLEFSILVCHSLCSTVTGIILQQ